MEHSLYPHCSNGWTWGNQGHPLQLHFCGGRVRIGDWLGVKADAQGMERKGGRVGICCRLEGKAAVEWGSCIHDGEGLLDAWLTLCETPPWAAVSFGYGCWVAAPWLTWYPGRQQKSGLTSREMLTEEWLDVQEGGIRMVATQVLQSLMYRVPLDMVAYINFANKQHANSLSSYLCQISD